MLTINKSKPVYFKLLNLFLKVTKFEDIIMEVKSLSSSFNEVLKGKLFCCHMVSFEISISDFLKLTL